LFRKKIKDWASGKIRFTSKFLKRSCRKTITVKVYTEDIVNQSSLNSFAFLDLPSSRRLIIIENKKIMDSLAEITLE